MNYLRAVTWWTLLSWSSLSACGSSGGASGAGAGPSTTPVESRTATLPAVHKRGAEKLIVAVGAAGGTLELDNGARLVIPAGALSENVDITFAEGARTTAFSNHEYERPIGPTLEIAPEMALGGKVQVSIPIAELPEGFDEQHLGAAVEGVAKSQRALPGQALQTRWNYGPAASEGGRAVAELEEIPGYRVQFVVSR